MQSRFLRFGAMGLVVFDHATRFELHVWVRAFGDRKLRQLR